VVFLFDALSKQYGAPKVWIVSTLSLTLATRPIGAVLFGFLADRYGRKRPLIYCVLYFSGSGLFLKGDSCLQRINSARSCSRLDSSGAYEQADRTSGA
jgi:Sugar (and other) transporter